MSNDWTVGKVAQRSGISISTLHFYERKGLIKSDRNAGNQRLYRKDILRRVSVIKAAQKLGISLAEIQQALATLPDSRTPTQKDWQALSAQWKQSLDERIAGLEKLRDTLDGCIGCGCLSMETCPLYNPEDKLAQLGAGPVLLEQCHIK
ncbi:redox-sensitive transcriptional activator SoxR [Vibrio metschnikovii]|uniref:redox-sensitive transcriptional activator SoxR n=1 Tax=Vibrio metschnikovii TaxID=28172 RepID=UPI001C2FC582|nr:redox-sensitive transcriptional activator SoxR [Vibrio metschnikovii]